MHTGGIRANVMQLLFRHHFHHFPKSWIAGHLVVCGLGRKGYAVTKAARAAGMRVVVIEPDAQNRLLGPARDAGAIIVLGDAREAETLRKARIDSARYVLALTGDDSTNAEIALQAGAQPRGSGARSLDRIVHIADPGICRLLEEEELGAHDPAGLEIFNVFDRAAQAIVMGAPLWSVDRAEMTAAPRLVLAGTGALAQSLALRFAWEWWVREINNPSPERLRIALVGPDAAAVVDALHYDNPWLKTPAELEPIDMRIPSLDFARAGFLATPDGPLHVNGIYVCLREDSEGLSTGSSFIRATPGTEVEVTVCMSQEAGKARLLEDAPHRTAGRHRLRTAGVITSACTLDLLPSGDREDLARAIHQRDLRATVGQDGETAPAPHALPWEQLPAHARRSSRNQADRYLFKMEMVGCSIARRPDGFSTRADLSEEEVEQIARADHSLSLVAKLARGRINGGVKDNGAGPDPSLLPWDQLAEEIKEMVRRPIRDVSIDLEAAGFQICPLKYWEAGSRE